MAFKSRITKKVTWGDLDALGIVFYPRFYEWMDEASHIFFDKIGLNLVGLLNEKNIIFALVETGATSTKPARYHDEIEIISYIKDIEEKTLFMRHKIRSLKDNSILMEGYEKRICVKQLSKEDLKAIAIPEDLRQILGMHK